MHTTSHPLAGATVKIKPGVTHPQVGDLGGVEYRIEDWWDKLTGGSWMDANGNPAAIIYAMRSGMKGLPLDDEVLYGKIGCLGHLMHVSELELNENHEGA